MAGYCSWHDTMAKKILYLVFLADTLQLTWQKIHITSLSRPGHCSWQKKIHHNFIFQADILQLASQKNNCNFIFQLAWHGVAWRLLTLPLCITLHSTDAFLRVRTPEPHLLKTGLGRNLQLWYTNYENEKHLPLRTNVSRRGAGTAKVSLLLPLSCLRWCKAWLSVCCGSVFSSGARQTHTVRSGR